MYIETNRGCLELPWAGTNFHGPNSVHAIEVLYFIANIAGVMRAEAGLGLPWVTSEDSEDSVPARATTSQRPVKIRSLFPETWLWNIVTTGWVG